MRLSHALICFVLLAGCCSTDSRRASAEILAQEAANLQEAWSIYKHATVPSPSLSDDAAAKVPEVRDKITHAIDEMERAALTLATEEGVE